MSVVRQRAYAGSDLQYGRVVLQVGGAVLGECPEFSGDPVAGLDTTPVTDAGGNLPIQLRHLPDQPCPELVLKSTSRSLQQLVDQLEGLVEVSCHCATVCLRKT